MFTEKSEFYGWGGVGGGRGVHEKPIYRGDCLKRGAWTVFRFKKRLDKKECGWGGGGEGGGGGGGGGLIPQCTL